MAELNWKALTRAVMHPVQVEIRERAAADPGERVSPVQVASELNVPLGNVSYHMRCLLERGLLKRAGTTPRRGAVQHHFKIAEKALS